MTDYEFNFPRRAMNQGHKLINSKLSASKRLIVKYHEENLGLCLRLKTWNLCNYMSSEQKSNLGDPGAGESGVPRFRE
jgi:hypothetical protein